MKYTVLTYIFAKYEFVREIPVKDPEAEYVLVTDDKNLISATWTVVYDEKLINLSTFDKCYYVRFHLFEYCKTEICVRIDGSIQIKDSLQPIVARFIQKDADIMLMVNPVHTYLHEDYVEWVNTRGYPQASADKALKKLYDLGYDSSYKGYYQANFVIERNNALTTELDLKTYNILKELGVDGMIDRFDQPIWSFVINKYFHEKLKVMLVDEYIITFSRYMQWCWHNSYEAIPFKINMKPSYLFNKLIPCEQYDYLGELKSDNERIDFLLSQILEYKKNITFINRQNQELVQTINKIQLIKRIFFKVAIILIGICGFVCVMLFWLYKVDIIIL